MRRYPVLTSYLDTLACAGCAAGVRRLATREDRGQVFVLDLDSPEHAAAWATARACAHPKGQPGKVDPVSVPELSTVGRILGGVVGLAKAAVNADPVPEEVRAERLAICAGCPQWTGWKCRVCGCFTAAKLRLASEACPEGRWGTWRR